jgi:hypothetical protein
MTNLQSACNLFKYDFSYTRFDVLNNAVHCDLHLLGYENESTGKVTYILEELGPFNTGLSYLT